MVDVHPNNILLGIKDVSVLPQLEQDEADNPSARKLLNERTIYISRSIPLTSGEPVLSDLGKARLCKKKQTGLIMPSAYRAPEVMLDIEWDKKVDIWAVAQTVGQASHICTNI